MKKPFLCETPRQDLQCEQKYTYRLPSRPRNCWNQRTPSSILQYGHTGATSSFFSRAIIVASCARTLTSDNGAAVFVPSLLYHPCCRREEANPPARATRPALVSTATRHHLLGLIASSSVNTGKKVSVLSQKCVGIREPMHPILSASTSTPLSTGRRIARWSSPSFARPGWSSLGPGSAKRSGDGFALPRRLTIRSGYAPSSRLARWAPFPSTRLRAGDIAPFDYAQKNPNYVGQAGQTGRTGLGPSVRQPLSGTEH